MSFAAVVFDLGGVVLESPLHAINEFEQRHGIEPDSITKLVGAGGSRSAWSALETGRITHDRFTETFEQELEEAGMVVSVVELMEEIERAARPRKVMLRALDRLVGAGHRLGALTNNWASFGGAGMEQLRGRFDVFVESWREGINKPDPRIYELVLERLELPAEAVVYLDDIGRNLKPARAMGMTTIKVDDPGRALVELGELVGLRLV